MLCISKVLYNFISKQKFLVITYNIANISTKNYNFSKTKGAIIFRALSHFDINRHLKPISPSIAINITISRS